MVEREYDFPPYPISGKAQGLPEDEIPLPYHQPNQGNRWNPMEKAFSGI
jgi:hypothetical protein